MKDLMNLPAAAYPPHLKILNEAAKARVLEAQKAQDYYDGNFWRYLEAEVIEWAGRAPLPKMHKEVNDYPGASAVQPMDYTPSRLEFRYPKFFIDEIASWMFENPVGLKHEDEKAYEVIESVHRKNKLDQKLLQAGGECSLTHGVAVKTLWNEDLGQVRTIFRPSRECFPVMNPDDVDIMEKVHFCAFQDDDKTIWRQTFELRESNGQMVCWVTEALYDLRSLAAKDPKPKEVLYDIPLFSGSRPIDFIPVVIIPNEPNLGEIWGKSDLEPLYLPINELCRKMSDATDALAFELFPITLLMNATESNIDDFEVSPGAVWELKGGDAEHQPDARKLESSLSSLPMLDSYVDRLINMLHQFSGVPNVTRDKVDSVGNISGVALKLMFTAIVSKCNRKAMYWKPGLQDVYDQVLRTAAVYQGFDYKEDAAPVEVTITPRVPQNELEQLEIQAREIELMVKRVVTVMKERGVADPEEELAAWLAERGQIDSSLNPDVFGAAIESEAAEEGE